MVHWFIAWAFAGCGIEKWTKRSNVWPKRDIVVRPLVGSKEERDRSRLFIVPCLSTKLFVSQFSFQLFSKGVDLRLNAVLFSRFSKLLWDGWRVIWLTDRNLCPGCWSMFVCLWCLVIILLRYVVRAKWCFYSKIFARFFGERFVLSKDQHHGINILRMSFTYLFWLWKLRLDYPKSIV